MAWCLGTAKPLSEQRSNIVNSNLRNQFRNSHIFTQENAFKNVVWKMVSTWSRPQCVQEHLMIMPSWKKHIQVYFTHISYTQSACVLARLLPPRCSPQSTGHEPTCCRRRTWSNRPGLSHGTLPGRMGTATRSSFSSLNLQVKTQAIQSEN